MLKLLEQCITDQRSLDAVIDLLKKHHPHLLKDCTMTVPDTVYTLCGKTSDSVFHTTYRGVALTTTRIKEIIEEIKKAVAAMEIKMLLGKI